MPTLNPCYETFNQIRPEERHTILQKAPEATVTIWENVIPREQDVDQPHCHGGAFGHRPGLLREDHR